MRDLARKAIYCELVVVGGGMSGVCCAVTAARQGVRVTLVQDRPVLGGNASSEVRLWVLGATSHMGNNNRWAREGGVIDEILLENLWRNPEGNAVLFDTVLLDIVHNEPNIALLLNTAIDDVVMNDGRISSARGFNSQNQTEYLLHAPFFVDASGDGILGFLAGADFRIGAESREEFREGLAPEQEEAALLGHSLYFYSRDTGKPVSYVAPSFALRDITRIPRYRDIRVADHGCRLWWFEYGGTLDTIAQCEEIKWELWSIAYGVWDYIKNSGHFADTANLTLEWVGTIPGKRESRRFMGDRILAQQDIVQQHQHADAVSFGGWAIDLHPPEGIYSDQAACTQYHSKGVYQIPLSSLYSRNVGNLFLAGRLISATHIAFGSTRVMATCASNGQAAGIAAAECFADRLRPRDLLAPGRIEKLQQRLLAAGQHIPGVCHADEADLARSAAITASSTMKLSHFPASSDTTEVRPYALLLPLLIGPVPRITLFARVKLATQIRAELWGSEKIGNTTPDVFLSALEVHVEPGGNVEVALDFAHHIVRDAHYFVILSPIAGVEFFCSELEVPGILVLSQKLNAAVAKSLVQSPPPNSGIDTFSFWLPERRPGPRSLAASFEPPLDLFEPANVVNGFARPWCGVNAWIPDMNDHTPHLLLTWSSAVPIRTVCVTFDTDFDHPLESVLMGHPERVMPGCVRSFRLTMDETVVADVSENHQTRWLLTFAEPVQVQRLKLEILERGPAPPAIFALSCY